MKWRTSFAFAVMLGLACVSCSNLSRQAPPTETRTAQVATKTSEQPQVSDNDQDGTFIDITPNRATVDNPFLLVLKLRPKAGCQHGDRDDRGKGLAEVPVRMDEDPQVQYAPPQFTVKPCKQKFVTVTVKKKGPGLASLTAYADGYKFYDKTLDVGFDGRVKVTTTAPLAYGEPGTLNVEVVSQDDKPLSFNADLAITLQAVDALLRSSDGQTGEWVQSLTLPLKPGARSSPQFQIKSQNLRGGTIHLSTSLSIGEDVVLSQENHPFEVAPVWWLPILLAIFGALLYSLYSILSDDKYDKVQQKIFASIVAGAIAWLFTGFDLLGLKLDTNSLRTYAITGFLFSFLGVDVLLSKKFPRTVHTPKTE